MIASLSGVGEFEPAGIEPAEVAVEAVVAMEAVAQEVDPFAEDMTVADEELFNWPKHRNCRNRWLWSAT